MRVKIGATWYSATFDTPIMVELDELDRRNIEGMPADYHYYACFVDHDTRSADEKRAWMIEGARYGDEDEEGA